MGIVERDVHRIISSKTLAVILLLSSIAAVLRAGMRGEPLQFEFAGGVTIADSDFHPIAPAARLADTIALSPPLIISKQQIDEVRSRGPLVDADALRASLEAARMRAVPSSTVPPHAPSIRPAGPGLDPARAAKKQAEQQP